MISLSPEVNPSLINEITSGKCSWRLQSWQNKNDKGIKRFENLDGSSEIAVVSVE